MNEIALRSTETLTDRMEYSKTLAASGLLPKAYRGQPANVLFAVEYGRSLGLDAITAINSVHVIEGRPTASAGLISALVRRAGHKLRVRVESDTAGPVAIAQIIRVDDPEWTFESRWDLDRAKRAGVTGKDVWTRYPEAMLKARAITEVAREACEEALLGVHYSPEELGAEVTEDGTVLDPPAAVHHRPGARIAEAAADTGADTAEAEQPVPPAVPAELMRQMGTLMRQASMGTEEALPFVTRTIGREITSRDEMTNDEVRQVITALEDPEQMGEPDEDGAVDAELVDEPNDTATAGATSPPGGAS